MAQAARQFEKYMTIVHGPEAAWETITRRPFRSMPRNKSVQIIREAVKEMRKHSQFEKKSSNASMLVEGDRKSLVDISLVQITTP
jgi:hypothetical protein